MTMEVEHLCPNFCPNGVSQELAVACRGMRARLDIIVRLPDIIDEAGDPRYQEQPILACGMPDTSPDQPPTISLEDYLSTPLCMAKLFELHLRGHLPQQAL